ncbi:Rhomboid family intramembrane serine protease [Balamuthia mandrillaris]
MGLHVVVGEEQVPVGLHRVVAVDCGCLGVHHRGRFGGQAVGEEPVALGHLASPRSWSLWHLDRPLRSCWIWAFGGQLFRYSGAGQPPGASRDGRVPGLSPLDSGHRGLGVWAVGRDEYIHVGASGVLFGVFAVLLAAPVVERPFRPLNFVSALVGGLIYGGMFFGFFGFDGKVSYESHICGFASGLLGAVMYFYLWQRVLRPKVGQDGRVVTVGRPEQKQQKKSVHEAGMDVELGHVGGNPFDEDDEEDLGPLEEPDDLNRYVVA